MKNFEIMPPIFFFFFCFSRHNILRTFLYYLAAVLKIFNNCLEYIKKKAKKKKTKKKKKEHKRRRDKTRQNQTRNEIVGSFVQQNHRNPQITGVNVFQFKYFMKTLVMANFMIVYRF